MTPPNVAPIPAAMPMVSQPDMATEPAETKRAGPCREVRAIRRGERLPRHAVGARAVTSRETALVGHARVGQSPESRQARELSFARIAKNTMPLRLFVVFAKAINHAHLQGRELDEFERADAASLLGALGREIGRRREAFARCAACARRCLDFRGG